MAKKLLKELAADTPIELRKRILLHCDEIESLVLAQDDVDQDPAFLRNRVVQRINEIRSALDAKALANPQRMAVMEEQRAAESAGQ